MYFPFFSPWTIQKKERMREREREKKNSDLEPDKRIRPYVAILVSNDAEV